MIPRWRFAPLVRVIGVHLEKQLLPGWRDLASFPLLHCDLISGRSIRRKRQFPESNVRNSAAHCVQAGKFLSRCCSGKTKLWLCQLNLSTLIFLICTIIYTLIVQHHLWKGLSTSSFLTKLGHSASHSIS